MIPKSSKAFLSPSKSSELLIKVFSIIILNKTVFVVHRHSMNDIQFSRELEAISAAECDCFVFHVTVRRQTVSF